jgi:PAS domain S-box-containing protein
MIIDKRPYHILVIEDNMGDFILIDDYLHETIENPQIIHSQTFRQSVDIIKNPAITLDVILLDLTLPDKSGEKLVYDILSLSLECPVIILSGNNNVEFSIHSITLGISDYLLKDDIRPTSLYKSIIYCIERSKQTLALKESEQRYSQLFDLSPQPMWVYDLETYRFLDVNLAAIKHYGFSYQDFMDMTLKDIRPPEDLEILEASIASSREENSLFTKGIFRHYNKNKDIIMVEIRANPIIYQGRKARIVLANDITEKLKYVHSIEAKNKQLSEIAWIQSHLVRAPLARIMGIVNLLKNSVYSNDEIQELIPHIISSANELDGLIMEISTKTYEAKNNQDESQVSS